MRFARIRAIILGLACVERAQWRAQSEAIEVTPEIRSIVALLASLGRGDPASYVRLLEAFEDRCERAYSATMGGVERGQAMRGALIGIKADLGIDDGPELAAEIADARRHGTVRREGAICDQFRLSAGLPTLSRRYGVEMLHHPVTPPRPTTAGRELAWTISYSGPERHLVARRWGFERFLSGKCGGPVQAPALNVRHLDSPVWTGLAGRWSRCLVPVEAFQQRLSIAGKAARRWFEVASSDPVSFAGIFRATADGIYDFAVLTCEPNGLLASAGAAAMPVLLQPEDEERWLASEQWHQVADLLTPFPSQLLRMIEAES